MEPLLHPIICFMGPSTSGKTFISEKIFQKNQKIITTTTRQKRPREQHGKDYYFLSKEEFLNLKSNDAFLETDEYAGFYYGTQKKEVFNKTQTKPAFAIVTVPGFYHLEKKLYPLVPVYLKINEATLLKRLKRRHLSEAEENIRLSIFKKELKQLDQLKKDFPHLIVQDNCGDPKRTIYQLKEKLALYL